MCMYTKKNKNYKINLPKYTANNVEEIKNIKQN